jgi:hypothetical protein
MRVYCCLVLLGMFLIGCARDQPIDGSGASAGEAEMVVSALRAGMSEEAVRDSMKPVALDSGTVYRGGSGARRLYFALPEQRQVWVECAGDSGGWKVVEVGRIEPRQRWVRHGGDSITVE